MESYNYKAEVYYDCLKFLQNNFEAEVWIINKPLYEKDIKEWASRAAGVTGLDTDGYWGFDKDAEKCLDGNIDLYHEAMKALEEPENERLSPLLKDTYIRCYLFGKCYEEAFEEFIDENQYDYKVTEILPSKDGTTLYLWESESDEIIKSATIEYADATIKYLPSTKVWISGRPETLEDIKNYKWKATEWQQMYVAKNINK